MNQNLKLGLNYTKISNRTIDYDLMLGLKNSRPRILTVLILSRPQKTLKFFVISNLCLDLKDELH